MAPQPLGSNPSAYSQITETPQPTRVAVVAFGGNAITEAGQRGTVEEMSRNLAMMAQQLVSMVETGYSVVITHGNGPQVGNIRLQQEAGEPTVPEMPLDVCGAMSQGQIGYLLSQAISNELSSRRLDKPVIALVTRCVVDPKDEAFTHPSKPIGPFYDEATAEQLRKEHGWVMVADSGRGFRRVVPSPVPQRIVERDQIRMFAGSGAMVVACGGGGVPVIETDSGRLEGVGATIDKDLGASLLAREVGADTLVLLTGVPSIYVNFGTPLQRKLGEIGLAELEKYLAQGQFPAGSMGPKVKAVIQFLRQGGEQAIITSPDLLLEALSGLNGTRVRRTHVAPPSTINGTGKP